MGLTRINGAAIARVTSRLNGRTAASGEASRTSVTVGIHEEEGGVEVEGGATVAAIALFHELGTSRIPRRSWLLDGLSENKTQFDEALRRVGRAVVAKRLRADVAYGQLGELIVAKLQARIRGNIPPPLAPATIAAKGSSTSLVDEGRLLASIRSRVREDLA